MPRKGEKQLLTREQEALARAAFARGATRDEVAFLLGVSRSILEGRMKDQLRDVRPGQGRHSNRRTEDPSPAEIEQRIEEIHRRRLMLFDSRAR
jgi:transposase